jgi:hypothetical protein
MRLNAQVGRLVAALALAAAALIFLSAGVCGLL